MGKSTKECRVGCDVYDDWLSMEARFGGICLDNGNMGEFIDETDNREAYTNWCNCNAPASLIAADLAQHILKGEKKRQDTDYSSSLDKVYAEAKHLNDDNLKELAYQAKVLRARQGGLPVPVRDERPIEAPLGPCTTWTPDKPPAGYDGSSGKRPLEQCSVDDIPFLTLAKWADSLGVSHNESQWLDDEWPDKEDELRVAVAEAMEKKKKNMFNVGELSERQEPRGE